MFYIIWSKGCKRCQGDLSLERDEDGLYVSCIQCGAVDAEMTKMAQMRKAAQECGESEGRKQRKLVGVAEPGD